MIRDAWVHILLVAASDASNGRDEFDAKAFLG